MKKNTMTLMAAGVCAAVVAQAANAGMVYWNMETASSTSNNISNLTVGSLTQGNNFGTTTMLSTTSPSSVYTFNLNGVTTNYSAANNAGAAARTGVLATGTSGSAYFEFTLTAGAGYTGSLTAIGFGTRSTSTGPVSFTLRSSADSYGSDLATASGSTTSTWSYKTATLTNAASLGQSTAVTFRLFGYGGTGTPTSGTANWRIDDMTLTGSTAAIPAPGCVALVGLAGMVASRRRRN